MANDELRREAIINEIIKIFIDVVGFLNEDEKKQVNANTHIIKDFDVDGDDALEVDAAIEKHFSVKISNEDWGQAVLIHEIADVVIKQLDKKTE